MKAENAEKTARDYKSIVTDEAFKKSKIKEGAKVEVVYDPKEGSINRRAHRIVLIFS